MERQKTNRMAVEGEKMAEETVEMTEGVETGEEIPGVLRDNRGVGVVEIILILVVLIALVVIFKEQLTEMVTKALDALEKSLDEVLS